MTFRDFIPEGEEAGAQTENGYQDFVEAKKPVLREVDKDMAEQTTPITKKVTPKKK